MASGQSEPHKSEAVPQRSIGLSDAAEQRWRELTGGRTHCWSSQLREIPPLAQALGFANRRTTMSEEYEDSVAPSSSAQRSQEANVLRGGGHGNFRATGGWLAAARPTLQLLDEVARDPDAPPLPASLLRLIEAGPFVPPEDEEWHIIDGWQVRISREEMEELLARADASESGGDDVDSLADTTCGSGSDPGHEDCSACESEKSDDEMTEGGNLNT
eukprot:TRINITY_DN2413_c0_g5_i1.p1 TRINITY_DN2413_c0_g5~~TRINITY_DN2413_c0_g5_i1.p1  ORF type:complete len:216 (-),score=41.26 TRINITY_DN2413_c0_g5_i1:293-940(-)